MLGMRTIKTGIAIVITLCCGDISFDVSVFCGNCNVYCYAKQYWWTYQSGIGRILGTALGGFGGILYTEYLMSQYRFEQFIYRNVGDGKHLYLKSL